MFHPNKNKMLPPPQPCTNESSKKDKCLLIEMNNGIIWLTKNILLVLIFLLFKIWTGMVRSIAVKKQNF